MSRYVVIDEKTHKVVDVANIHGYDHAKACYLIQSIKGNLGDYYDDKTNSFSKNPFGSAVEKPKEIAKPIEVQKVAEVVKPVEAPKEDMTKPVEKFTITDTEFWKIFDDKAKPQMGKQYHVKNKYWEGDAFWSGKDWVGRELKKGGYILTPIQEYAEVKQG